MTYDVTIFGINGKIDPLSEYDEVDEEVIYSQEFPNMVEVFRDLTGSWIDLLSKDYQLKNHFSF